MIDDEQIQRNRLATMRSGRALRDVIRLAVPTVIEYQAVGEALPRWIEELPAIVWVAICRRVQAHEAQAGVAHPAAACV